MKRSLTTMNAIANRLYQEQSPNGFLETFTPLELCKLWYEFCVLKQIDGELVGGANYDDEVYDALNAHGYWDMV